jgi:predicted permease
MYPYDTKEVYQMSELLFFFQEMIVLYGIAFIGYVAKRRNILSQASDQVFTQLILYITLPSLILFSMDFPFSFSLLKEFAWLILLSAYALGVACLLAFFMVKKSNLPSSRRGVYGLLSPSYSSSIRCCLDHWDAFCSNQFSLCSKIWW